MIRFFVKLYKSYKYVDNSSLALANEYARGVEEALSGFQKAHKKATDVIDTMAGEEEDRHSELRKACKERIDSIEKSWHIKCKLCKQYTENERIRLRGMQNYISRYMYEFTEVYNALLRNISFVQDANDKILKGSAIMKDSSDRLEILKKSADKLIAEAEPVLRLTEEDIAKKRAKRYMSTDKRKVQPTDGQRGEGTSDLPGAVGGKSEGTSKDQNS